MALKIVLIGAAYLTACMLIAYLGRNRKWGYWGYLWSSVLFTPAMGLLFVLASDPKKPPRKKQADDADMLESEWE